MDIVISVLFTAVLLSLIFGFIYHYASHHGLFIKTVYVTDDTIIQGRVVPEIPDADQAFFDEHDVAVMEARAERPEFVKTTILINGIRMGPDGQTPEDAVQPRRTIWERIRGD